MVHTKSKPFQSLHGAEKAALQSLGEWSLNQEKATRALKIWGDREEDSLLKEIMTEAAEMLSLYSDALFVYADEIRGIPEHMKSVGPREDALDEVRKRRDAHSSKTQSLESKIANMAVTHKKYAEQRELLEEYKEQERVMNAQYASDESALGDFRRSTIKQWMLLKFRGLRDCARKAAIVGELGMTLLEKIGAAGLESDNHSKPQTEYVLSEARRRVGELSHPLNSHPSSVQIHPPPSPLPEISEGAPTVFSSGPSRSLSAAFSGVSRQRSDSDTGKAFRSASASIPEQSVDGPQPVKSHIVRSQSAVSYTASSTSTPPPISLGKNVTIASRDTALHVSTPTPPPISPGTNVTIASRDTVLHVTTPVPGERESAKAPWEPPGVWETTPLFTADGPETVAEKLARVCLAFGPKNSYFFNGPSRWSHKNLPTPIQILNDDKIMQTIYGVALGPNGAFFIGYTTHEGLSYGSHAFLPKRLDEWLGPFWKPKRDIPSLRVVLGPDSFFAIDKSGMCWDGLPSALLEIIQECQGAQVPDVPKLMALGAGGSYFMVTRAGKVYHDLAQSFPDMYAKLDELGHHNICDLILYVSLSPHEPGRYACVLQDGDTFGNVPDDWLEDCTRVNEDIKAISPSGGGTSKVQTFSAVKPTANPKMMRRLASILIPGIRRKAKAGQSNSKDSDSIRGAVVNIGASGGDEGHPPSP